MKNKIPLGQRSKAVILKLRKEGKSLEAIGRVIKLSRERVRQLERVWGLPARQKILKARVDRACANPKCRKIMHLLPTDRRQNCCRACHYDKFKKTLSERRKIWRERHYRYYHKVMVNRPDFKKYIKSCNDKYQKNKNKKHDRRK